MKTEIHVCQNCKADFSIEPEDFGFYKNISAPLPTWCPDCRFMRRFATWNIHTLYKDKCNLCKKEVITVYDPEMRLNIFCNECFSSDKWDPLKYGRRYDFSKNFFEQVYEFFKEVPRQALEIRNCSNCDFCHSTLDSKNCYMLSGGYHAEDCMYSQSPLFSKSVIESDWIIKGEKIYGSANCEGAYNLMFCRHANECLDSAFLFDCKGCSNCFGCVGLRNKSYYIFNKPYSKEEYEQEMKNWDVGSYKGYQKAKKKFEKLYHSTPRRFAFMTNAVDCTGSNITNSKNCKVCFNTIEGVENCKYVYLAGLGVKDSYDISGCGLNSELLYETTDTIGQKVSFSDGIHYGQGVEYSFRCFQVKDLFACMSLRNKQHCILNKQYSKEKYKKLKGEIIEHMVSDPYIDKQGKLYKYGEFFPVEHSPFYYNLTSAFFRYPISKEKALDNGYQWKEKQGERYKPTFKVEDIPDHIKDVEDAIVKESVECEHKAECEDSCKGAFRVTAKELAFYRQFNVPLPRLCPNCRAIARLKTREIAKVWKRSCMCLGEYSEKSRADGQYKNKTFHFHGSDKCTRTFQASYSPEDKEIVYCEDCYNQEVV